MYKDLKFLAIIPARGGSKGIPKKNVIDLNGKPLIQYTIDAAKNSVYIDDVIVSTDSQEIADVALCCGAEVPFLRPEELASDTTKTIEVLIHCLEELRIQDRRYDYLVLLQPTQPLRLSHHIDEAIEKIIKLDSDSLTSVTPVKDHPILVRNIDDNHRLVPLLSVSSTIRRQDFPDYFKVNGAIYINKISNLTLETSLNDNVTPYMMDHKYSIDIDEPIDLDIARAYLNHQG